jgi:DNA-binding transcriptional MerR regulator
MKVGELARSTGLTVRTLHHYDEIGLLTPSGRSEAGYRLYGEADVAKLHGIQALRHLGLPLADIAALFEGRGAAPGLIIEQQLNALEREIARANELRGRLALLREKLAEGVEPGLQEWLDVLQSMATYGKYFSAQEIKGIFARWNGIKDDWTRLVVEVQAAMDAGARPESPIAQSLARRWMTLMFAWMDHDFGLLDRWDRMYRQEPYERINKEAPPLAMIEFMRAAAGLRMALLQQHFSPEELARIRYVPENEWQAVEAQAQQLLQAGVPAHAREARAVLKRWQALTARLTDGDTALRDKLQALVRTEPLLRDSAPISAASRSYLLQAQQKKALDPHVA